MSVLIYIVVPTSSQKNKLSTSSEIDLATSSVLHPFHSDKPVIRVTGKPAKPKCSSLAFLLLFSRGRHTNPEGNLKMKPNQKCSELSSHDSEHSSEMETARRSFYLSVQWSKHNSVLEWIVTVNNFQLALYVWAAWWLRCPSSRFAADWWWDWTSRRDATSLLKPVLVPAQRCSSLGFHGSSC